MKKLLFLFFLLSGTLCAQHNSIWHKFQPGARKVHGLISANEFITVNEPVKTHGVQDTANLYFQHISLKAVSEFDSIFAWKLPYVKNFDVFKDFRKAVPFDSKWYLSLVSRATAGFDDTEQGIAGQQFKLEYFYSGEWMYVVAPCSQIREDVMRFLLYLIKRD